MMNSLINNSKRFLKLNVSTILTGIATVGVIATSIMTAKATVKAVRLLDEKKSEQKGLVNKHEVIKIVAPVYISTLAIGVSTVICLLSANAFNRKQQASLISAYSLVNNSYKNYRNKVKEMYGEEAHSKIVDAIAVEKADDINIYTECICSVGNLLPNDYSTTTIKFYDEYSNRFFESTMERVLIAEYHLNRNFVLRGYAYLNEFYEFLGLELTDYGSVTGWEIEDEFYWIDFNHRIAKTDHMEYIDIEILYAPTHDVDELEMTA